MRRGSFFIEEMRINSTLRYHYTSLELVKLKNEKQN